MAGAREGQQSRAAVLVGRQAELDAMRASVGAGRSVALLGVRGSGRTALVREVAAQRRAAGDHVVWLSPTAALAAVPLGVMCAFVPPGTPVASAEAVVAARAALVGAAHGRVIVVVDDAQWLDALSASVLLDLVASGSAQAVVAVRLDDPLPDGLLRLWKDDLADVVDLPRLTERKLRDVAAAQLGGAVDPAAVRSLSDLAGGDLPALVSLIERSRRSGALVRRGELWRLAGPVPVTEALALADGDGVALSAEHRIAVDVLTVAGSVAVDALLAVTTEGCIDELEAAGVVVLEDGEDHRLVARLRVPARSAGVHSGATLARRRRLLDVAAALDARGATVTAPPADAALAAALLRIEAGRPPEPMTALAAARTALMHGRLDAAAALAEAALRAAGSQHDPATSAGAVGVRVAAGLLLATIEARRGRGEDADARLAALGAEVTDPAEVAAVACARIDHLLNALFRPEAAWEVAAVAAPRLEGTPHAAGVAIRRGLLALVGGDLPAGAALIEPALEQATGNALVAGCWVAAYGRVMRGQMYGALDLLDRAVATADAPSSVADDGDLPPWDRRMLDSLRCMALGVSGRIADADALAAESHRAAIADGDASSQALYAWCRAGVALTAGRAGTAQRRAAEANAIYADIQAPTQQRLALHDLARSMALLGNIAGARTALDSAEAIDQRLGRDLWAESGRLRSEAWLAAADGELATARTHLEACLANAQMKGEPINELAARHDLVRFGATGHADALDELVATFDGDQPRAIAAYVRGVEDDDADLLGGAVDAFESMGLVLFAAEAAAALAEVLGRQGRARDAAAAGARAATFASACEGAGTPALTVRGVLANLSPRETEVARLAARGLANREIAARLYVSVRTVESQLQRAYAKLGIRSRDQLAGALDP